MTLLSVGGLWLIVQLRRKPVIVYANRSRTQVYVKRWSLIWTKPFMCVVHRFFSADPDDPHNHVGLNISIVLGGRGVERCYDAQQQLLAQKILRRGSIVVRTTNHIHCIDSDPGSPLLTLFILIPRLPLDRWGFFTTNGYVPAQLYCKTTSQKKPG